MSKTRKLRPADRHITRAECQALIVHTLNEVFGKLAEPSPPRCGCVPPAACTQCTPPSGGYAASVKA